MQELENNLSFKDFDIESSIMDGISDLGFLTPTPIQQKALM